MPEVIVRVQALDCHPCKRRPLPFIFAEVRFSTTCLYQTCRSNGLPPTWPEIFRIPLGDVDDQTNLVIEFKQSRLFMCDETIGVITLPLRKIIADGGIDEWIPVENNSCSQAKAHILITNEITEEQITENPDPDPGPRREGLQRIFDEFF